MLYCVFLIEIGENIQTAFIEVNDQGPHAVFSVFVDWMCVALGVFTATLN